MFFSSDSGTTLVPEVTLGYEMSFMALGKNLPQEKFYQKKPFFGVVAGVVYLILIFLCAYFSYSFLFSKNVLSMIALFSISLVVVVFLLSMYLCGVSELKVSEPATQVLSRQLRVLFYGVCCTLIFFVTLSISFKASGKYLWPWIFYVLFYTFFLMLFFRIALFLLVCSLRTKGYLLERIVLVGSGTQTTKVLSHLRDQLKSGVHVLGVFDDRMQRDELTHDLVVLGSFSDVSAYCRSYQVERLLVTLPWMASVRVDNVLRHLRTVLAMANGRIKQQTGLIKRAEDFFLSILLLFLPLMLCAVFAIKLISKGPVLVAQQRHGVNNKVFLVYKFRLMYLHNEQFIVQEEKKDLRVSRVGSFLRKTRLDDLPQLFNVLIGNMSIVGLRPHALQRNFESSLILAEYFARHNVKPCITGWA